MAQIIPLHPRARPAHPAALLPEGARILFFLGVRYMHAEEPCSAPDPRGESHAHRGGGKKRRRRRA